MQGSWRLPAMIPSLSPNLPAMALPPSLPSGCGGIKQKKRSCAEVKRLFERDVLPQWKGRKIGDITRHDCLLLIDSIADRGAATMARRLHAHLHRFFRWSVGRGVIAINPIADAPKLGAENPRDRVLTDDELKAVWQGANEIGWPFGPIAQLLMLTGMRREEIGGLRWDEIEFERSEIRLSGNRTKTNQSHVIPMSTQVIEVVLKAPRLLDCPFVFSTNSKNPVSGWAKAKARLDKASGIEAWRLHDLRRTMATGLQRLGVSLQTVEAILGHVSGSRAGIVGIYQRHDYAHEKRAALELWGENVSRLTSDNVVGLRGGHAQA
jgi:integrase